MDREWKKLQITEKRVAIKHAALRAVHDHNNNTPVELSKTFLGGYPFQAAIIKDIQSKYGEIPGSELMRFCLNELVKDGLLQLKNIGKPKRYDLTDAGMAYLRDRKLIPQLSINDSAVRQIPDSFVTEALGHALARAASSEEIAERDKMTFEKYGVTKSGSSTER